MRTISNNHLCIQPVDKLKDNQIMGYLYSENFNYCRFTFDYEKKTVKVHDVNNKLFASFKIPGQENLHLIQHFLNFFREEKAITPVIGIGISTIYFYLMDDEGKIIGVFTPEHGDPKRFVLVDDRGEWLQLGSSPAVTLFKNCVCHSVNNAVHCSLFLMNGEWLIKFNHPLKTKVYSKALEGYEGITSLAKLNQLILTSNRKALDKIEEQVRAGNKKYFINII
mgnify:CR=1 FL=1